MTISSTTSRWTYTGDGATTEFGYNNKIFADSDLDVYVDDVLQTLSTDYTVSGAGEESGGDVAFNSAPANDADILIVRNVANNQETDYPFGGPFPSRAVEDDLDRRTVVSQDLFRRLGLMLGSPESDTDIYDADGNRIVNVGDPEESGDAVNVEYLAAAIETALANLDLSDLDLGTAAAKDVQESRTDTTSGRLLIMGAFGLGPLGGILLDDTNDLDSINDNGFYRWNTINVPANAPVGGEAGRLIVNAGGGSPGYGMQLVVVPEEDSVFIRTQHHEAAWSDWKEITGVDTSAPRAFTGQQYFALQTLTDAANIDWNLNGQQVAEVTLGGNRTLNNPTNIRNGASYLLYVRQDATGNRVPSWDANYDFGDDGAPTLSTDPHSGDLLGFVAIDGKMLFTGIKQGFAVAGAGNDWAQVGNSLDITGAGLTASAALDSTHIAYFDDGHDELKTYTFDGTDWSQDGNSLEISISGRPSLAALDSNTVAYFNDGLDELRTYSWDGTDWSQAGNSFGISVDGATALAVLNSTDVAFLDSDNQELRTYRFDGTDWSQIGNSLAISVIASEVLALAALNGTDVAFFDANIGINELRTYRFDGADWVQIGNSLEINAPSNTVLAALNGTDIAFFDALSEDLRTYRFNGTDWAQVGGSIEINVSGGFEMSALSSTRVSFIDYIEDELRTYEFS